MSYRLAIHVLVHSLPSHIQLNATKPSHAQHMMGLLLG